jgi:hypothetical protein
MNLPNKNATPSGGYAAKVTRKKTKVPYWLSIAGLVVDLSVNLSDSSATKSNQFSRRLS